MRNRFLSALWIFAIFCQLLYMSVEFRSQVIFCLFFQYWWGVAIIQKVRAIIAAYRRVVCPPTQINLSPFTTRTASNELSQHFINHLQRFYWCLAQLEKRTTWNITRISYSTSISHFPPLSFSLSHTHTHTHSLSLFSNTHTHTHTVSLSLSLLSLSLSLKIELMNI